MYLKTLTTKTIMYIYNIYLSISNYAMSIGSLCLTAETELYVYLLTNVSNQIHFIFHR